MKKNSTILLVGAGLILAVIVLSTREKTPPSGDTPTGTVQPAPSPTDKKIAVLSDKEQGYSQKIQTLAELRREKDLASLQVEKLMDVIRDSKAHPTVRNDALSVLERQEKKLPGLGAELIRMWQDTKEGHVWRDFCLQHMAPTYEFASDRKVIEDALTEATKSTESSYAGTAMLTLRRIGEKHPEIMEKVKAISLALLKEKDKKVREEQKISAFHVANETGAVDVLPDARKTAVADDSLIRLRMSAIAMIGNHGEKRDLSLLEKLSKEKDSRISRAAKLNLEKLKKKLSL